MVAVTYTPGTIKNPQHTKLTEASFTDTDHVHFPDGRLSTIPPYQDVTPGTMYGGIRTIHGIEFPDAGFNYLFGTNTHLYVLRNGTLYNITPLETTGTLLGSNPLAFTNGSPNITVTMAGHGLATGDRVRLGGIPGALNGIPEVEMEAEHIVTYLTASTFSIPVSTNANATSSTGGAAVTVYRQIESGALNQAFPAGWGAGLFGSGLWGDELPATTGIYNYPRIWSIADQGNDLILCPGDFFEGNGTLIYVWDGDLSSAPTPLTNAPEDCNFVLTVNNAVVALCGNRIDITAIGDATTWYVPGVIGTAYQATLQRVTRLTSGIKVGDKSALLFSENEVFLLRYVGGADIWDIVDLYDTDGIIGPQAACVLNGIAYWRGRAGEYRFAGTFVEQIPNAQNGEYVNLQLNRSQASKCFVTPDIENNQVYFHYVFGADNEPGYYNIYNPAGGHWTLGEMARTAAMKRFVGAKLYYANGISETESGEVYRHYVIDEDITLDWYAQTAEAKGGGRRMLVSKFIPDAFQTGDISVQYLMREYPNDAAPQSFGPYASATTSRYVTTKAAGRLRAIRFSGTGQATLGAWEEEIRFLGGRPYAT